MGNQDFGKRGTFERRLACEKEIGDRSERVNVATGIGRTIVQGLFRGRVQGRTGKPTPLGQARVFVVGRRTCETEIEQLRNVVTQCRKLLEESIAQTLQGQFGIYAGQRNEVHIEEEFRMTHLAEEDQLYRGDIIAHFEHIKALGYE